MPPGLRDRIRSFRERTRTSQLLLGSALLSALIIGLWGAASSTRPPTPEELEETIARAIASASPRPAAAIAVYEKVAQSVVEVRTRRPGAPDDAGGNGVILDDTGHILTSLHLVSGAGDIRVLFADGSEAEARVIAEEAAQDIAVLRAFDPPPTLVPAVLGSSASLRIGEEAFVIGSPFRLSRSLTAGVISGLERTHQPAGRARPLTGLIQFDAAVNPGSSGGPLVNREGDVVGIVLGLTNPTNQGTFIGIGFAVPIEAAAGALGVPPD